VTVGSIATVFERIMPDAFGACEYHYVLVDFFCTVQGGSLCAGTDSKRAEWVPLSDLKHLPMTSGTSEVINLCCNGSGPYPVVTRP
jgi:hypothetical protein